MRGEKLVQHGHIGCILALEVADGLQQRIDTAILRLSFGESARQIAREIDRFRFGEWLASSAGEFLQLIGLHLSGDLAHSGIGFDCARQFGGRANIHGRCGLTTAPFAVFTGLVENVIQCEVVTLREGIEFMIVALRAAQRQPHPDSACGLHAIHHVLHARLLGDAPALAIDHVIAIEAAREFLLGRGIRQKITRELPDRELIVGHVVIDRLHHPVTPWPHGALRIALVAVAVGVACRIQPVPSPALAEVRAGEETFDDVGQVRLVRRGRRRESRQIQGEPAHECFP